MDVVGQGWEVMRPAGSGADLAACWRRWVEDALGGKLLLLVLCAVVASLAPPWQAGLLSSAFLAPPAPPRGIWVRSHSLVLSFSKLIARMLPCLTTPSRESTGAFISFAVAIRRSLSTFLLSRQAPWVSDDVLPEEDCSHSASQGWSEPLWMGASPHRPKKRPGEGKREVGIKWMRDLGLRECLSPGKEHVV